MSANNSANLEALGIPPIPAIASDFLKLKDHLDDRSSHIDALVLQYPQFFKRLLNVINADYFGPRTQATSLNHAIELFGFEHVLQFMLIQVVQSTLDQYKILSLDSQAFWQDSLRRAVSAKMVGEIIGLDACLCFCAGFMQDIGLFLLFIEQPEKAVLWESMRKREPEARLSMEQNIFGLQHDSQLSAFLEAWGILPQLEAQLSLHHYAYKVDLAELGLNDFDQQLCKVLHCADWMTAVYTAEDKSFVINHCRKILSDHFQMELFRAEELLAVIPEKVDLLASILEIDVQRHTAFSQILYEANIRLNEDNINFQELTSRLEQAIDERDKLAAEINRDLNLAREIQQSLLPVSQGELFPINGINLSAKILSGDFYDFFELENGDIYFNLGDVSGKGVNAALLMAKTCSLFRCLGKRIDEPGQLMYEVNNELCETSVYGMFVTMVAGLYRQKTGEIQLVNAGNPPALLFTESGLCQEIEATAPPLGVMPDTVYTAYNFNLKNDSLYIYSDGVTEGFVDEKTMLEMSGLFKLIAMMDKTLPPDVRLKMITDKFTGRDKPLRDDVTLLLLEKTTEI